MGDKWHEGVSGYNSLYGFFSFYFRVKNMFYYEEEDGYIMETRPTVIEDGPR